MDQTNLPTLRRKLLHWYDTNRRDLPWRRTADPYAIWVAETMLQQTQVKTVLPYYERFMRAMPTVNSLVRSPLRQVLALWSGLGYYRRAENLWRAARVVSKQFGGKIPGSYQALCSLPGIGDYTAGAVMSIAFNQPLPALDANARRVLGRVFQLEDEKELRRVAEQLVSRTRPGHWNQALMDLGATICTPREPQCPRCPLSNACRSRAARGLQSVKPSRRSRRVEWPLALIRHGDKLLLRRRAANGLLPGLWEFPGGEKSKRESLRGTLRRCLAELNDSLVLDRRLGAFRHTITNRRIVAPVFLFSLAPDSGVAVPNVRWRWFRLRSLKREAVSAMTMKAMTLLSRYEENVL